jgi:hemoglobin
MLRGPRAVVKPTTGVLGSAVSVRRGRQPHPATKEARLTSSCAGRWAAGALLVAAVIGCAPVDRDTPLYDRLGGLPVIQKVVDGVVASIAADGRINGRFAGADVARLKRHLVDQICEASGGPCRYTGRSMRVAHAGLKITDAEFTALVEDVVSTLDRFQVPPREKSELVYVLASMKKDVVGR